MKNNWYWIAIAMGAGDLILCVMFFCGAAVLESGNIIGPAWNYPKTILTINTIAFIGLTIALVGIAGMYWKEFVQ